MKMVILCAALVFCSCITLAQGETRDRSTPPAQVDTLRKDRPQTDQEYNRNDTLRVRDGRDTTTNRNYRNNQGTMQDKRNYDMKRDTSR